MGEASIRVSATYYGWFRGENSAPLAALFSNFARGGVFDPLLCTGQQLFKGRKIHRLNDVEVEPCFL